MERHGTKVRKWAGYTAADSIGVGDIQDAEWLAGFIRVNSAKAPTAKDCLAETTPPIAPRDVVDEAADKSVRHIIR